jgi:hypothetical protein
VGAERTDVGLGGRDGSGASRCGHDAARTTLRCVRGPASAGLVNEANRRGALRHFGGRRGGVCGKTAKPRCAAWTTGDETGHKRDEAAREGSLRDSRRLAFVIRTARHSRNQTFDARDATHAKSLRLA